MTMTLCDHVVCTNDRGMNYKSRRHLHKSSPFDDGTVLGFDCFCFGFIGVDSLSTGFLSCS